MPLLRQRRPRALRTAQGSACLHAALHCVGNCTAAPLPQTLVEGLDGEIVATTTEPVPMLVNHRPEETARRLLWPNTASLPHL